MSKKQYLITVTIEYVTEEEDFPQHSTVITQCIEKLVERDYIMGRSEVQEASADMVGGEVINDE